VKKVYMACGAVVLGAVVTIHEWTYEEPSGHPPAIATWIALLGLAVTIMAVVVVGLAWQPERERQAERARLETRLREARRERFERGEATESDLEWMRREGEIE